MKYRNLGAAGVKVSSLCLGAMTFGEADEKSFMHKVGSDEATAHAVLDRALAAGINFIDTADVYGQDGLSERVLGNWIAARGARDKIVLATKFRFTMGDGAEPQRRVALPDRQVLRGLAAPAQDRSHRPLSDPHAGHHRARGGDAARARRPRARRQGALHRLLELRGVPADEQPVAARRRTAGRSYVTLQAQYSLLVRDLEREHVPLCREKGLGILPWSPLAGGFLTGKFERGKPPTAARASARRRSGSRATTTSATGRSSTPCARSPREMQLDAVGRAASRGCSRSRR